MQKIKVGVTGGIGSGKSTIARIFESMGYPVYYADARAKNLLVTNKLLISDIKHLFGDDIYQEDGQINRKKLGSIVFNNKEKLAQLNALVHPAVAQDFFRWTEKQTTKIVFEEAAILFETGAYKRMDFNILVTAPKEERIKRTMSRDNASREEILSRMENQWEDEQKIPLADFLIDNGGEVLVIPQVLEVLKKLKV